MVEYNTSLVVLNVLGTECSVPALKIKDLLQIKTAINLPFSMRLQYILKIFYDNINLYNIYDKQYFRTFEDFLFFVSYYEIESFAYTYTLSTFDTGEVESYEKIIKCPNCENVIRRDISIKDFASIKHIKIWNKQQKYYEYTFNHTISLNNSASINVQMFIPNILIFLKRIRGVSNSTIQYNIKKYNNILDPITELTLHTKKVTVNNIIIQYPNEIYDFYNELPANIFDQIFSFYNSNINIYKPKYSYDNIICPKCNTQINLTLSPLLEFLSISDNININKTLDEYLDLFQVLFTTTNEHFTDLNSFFNLPYPIYLKLSKQFLKSFEKKLKALKNKHIITDTLGALQ